MVCGNGWQGQVNGRWLARFLRFQISILVLWLLWTWGSGDGLLAWLWWYLDVDWILLVYVHAIYIYLWLVMFVYVHAGSIMFNLVHFSSVLVTHAGKAVGEEIDAVHVGMRSYAIIQSHSTDFELDGCPSHFQDVTVSIHDWKSLSQWNPETFGNTHLKVANTNKRKWTSCEDCRREG